MNRWNFWRATAAVSFVLTLATTVSAQSDLELDILSLETFSTLDVAVLATSNSQSSLLLGIHDPLIHLEADVTFSPALATEWTVSDDGLTYTFKLREGVSFHDGTPWNAEAAVWNINAGLSEEIGGSAMADYAPIESAEAVDEYTLQVNMSYSDAKMLTVFTAGTSTQALMMSPTAYETMGPDEYAANPVGTGPFEFVRWIPSVEVVVERNEDYWGEVTGNADRVTFRVIVDNSAATLSYQSGDVEVIFPALSSELPLLETVEGTVVETSTQGFVELGLNTQIPPFDNVHNRRALRYAIDVEPIIALVYGGYAQPARGFIPPGTYPYNEEAPDLITRDLDTARSELEAAGNPDGFSFEVSVVAQPYRTQTLEIMQASLAEVGINLIIQSNERARHLEVLRQTPNEANAGFIQQLRFIPTPESYLTIQGGCTPANLLSPYCTDEWKGVWDQLATTPDLDERTILIQQLDQMMMRDVVSLPYLYPEVPLVYRGDLLENVALSPYGFLDWVSTVVNE